MQFEKDFRFGVRAAVAGRSWLDVTLLAATVYGPGQFTQRNDYLKGHQMAAEMMVLLDEMGKAEECAIEGSDDDHPTSLMMQQGGQ
jgi:hypothetical protein